MYLGKIKTASHRKVGPTFIDDVLEKFRAHNQQEERRGRQTSLPVHPTESHNQIFRFPRPNSLSEMGESHELRHIFTSKLVRTQEEEESSESQPNLVNSDNTLAILKQTEAVLKTFSNRIEHQNVSNLQYPENCF